MSQNFSYNLYMVKTLLQKLCTLNISICFLCLHNIDITKYENAL